MSVGLGELIIIVMFVLLIFGAKRIPEVARALGRAQYEFNKAKRELIEDEQNIPVGEENSGTAQEK